MELDVESEWHSRFIEMARLVASWSKDPSTKCGAVIVRPDKTVASVGFNGFPKDCSDNKEYYENRNLKLARVIHAEVNAILHAREPLQGYNLYTVWPGVNGPTCDRCTTLVIQSGIKNVYYPSSDITAARWSDSVERALQMYDEVGVNVYGI